MNSLAASIRRHCGWLPSTPTCPFQSPVLSAPTSRGQLTISPGAAERSTSSATWRTKRTAWSDASSCSAAIPLFAALCHCLGLPRGERSEPRGPMQVVVLGSRVPPTSHRPERLHDALRAEVGAFALLEKYATGSDSTAGGRDGRRDRAQRGQASRGDRYRACWHGEDPQSESTSSARP